MSRIIIFFLVVIVFVQNCQEQPQNQLPGSDVEWARGIVWYQIFPERFRNAVEASDPVAAEVPGAEAQPGWRIHPWGSDWFKIQPWEREESDYFYDVVYDRRYGGDLIGVTQKLDYLQDLGVEGIYFNPVFEAPSLHKYDGSTFHHIDDNFGPDAAADKAALAQAAESADPSTWIWTTADSAFLKLISEAHKRDIRVVIDGVFNHTGTEFFAFKDVVSSQQQSPYANWYDIKSWDDPSTEENEFEYSGWWGFKGLPEFHEDENGPVPAVRDYIFAATSRWMDPNGDGDPSDGIDGWRLDVADEVAEAFWRDWYRHVKTINPRALVVAEVWNDASEAVKNSQFDGAMNYPFAYATMEFFINSGDKSISGPAYLSKLDTLYKNYGQASTALLWNLMDSHDTDRLASMILNPNLNFDRMRSPIDNPDYVLRKPTREERAKQELIVAFKMAWIGAPLIFYGTEAGIWGPDDPGDRKPMVWPDIEFEPESHHPIAGKTRPSDPNSFDSLIYDYYKTLILLRKNNNALRKGNFVPMYEQSSEDVAVFRRETETDTVYALFNRGSDEVEINLPAERAFTDLMDVSSYESDGGNVRISMEPMSFKLLE